MKDLVDQNEVLVQTVEQLESEANERVGKLEEKLNKAVVTAKVNVLLLKLTEHLYADTLLCCMIYRTVIRKLRTMNLSSRAQFLLKRSTKKL